MCPRPVACLVRCAPLSERGRVQHMLAARERQSGWGHGDVVPHIWQQRCCHRCNHCAIVQMMEFLHVRALIPARAR